MFNYIFRNSDPPKTIRLKCHYVEVKLIKQWISVKLKVMAKIKLKLAKLSS